MSVVLVQLLSKLYREVALPIMSVDLAARVGVVGHQYFLRTTWGTYEVPFRASHAQAGSTPLRVPGHVLTGSLLAMGQEKRRRFDPGLHDLWLAAFLPKIDAFILKRYLCSCLWSLCHCWVSCTAILLYHSCRRTWCHGWVGLDINIFSGPPGGQTRVPFRANRAQAGSTPLRNPGHVRTGSLLAMGPD